MPRVLIDVRDMVELGGRGWHVVVDEPQRARAVEWLARNYPFDAEDRARLGWSRPAIYCTTLPTVADLREALAEIADDAVFLGEAVGEGRLVLGGFGGRVALEAPSANRAYACLFGRAWSPWRGGGTSLPEEAISRLRADLALSDEAWAVKYPEPASA